MEAGVPHQPAVPAPALIGRSWIGAQIDLFGTPPTDQAEGAVLANIGGYTCGCSTQTNHAS